MLTQLAFNIRTVRETFLLNLHNGEMRQVDGFPVPGKAEIEIDRDALLAMMAHQGDAGILDP